MYRTSEISGLFPCLNHKTPMHVFFIIYFSMAVPHPHTISVSNHIGNRLNMCTHFFVSLKAERCLADNWMKKVHNDFNAFSLCRSGSKQRAHRMHQSAPSGRGWHQFNWFIEQDCIAPGKQKVCLFFALFWQQYCYISWKHLWLLLCSFLLDSKVGNRMLWPAT